MLDPGKHTAPITAVQSFVNNPADFNVDSVPFDYFVVYSAQQFEDQALITHIGIATVTSPEDAFFRGEIAIVSSPSFGFVMRLLCLLRLPQFAPFAIHVGNTATR